MTEAIVDVEGRTDPLVIRINGADPTFYLATDRLRARALADLDPVLLDLLEIAAVVFAADGTVRRGGATRPKMGTDWRRGFRFRIPVRNPDVWSQPEILAALVDTITFLTDDSVTMSFSQADRRPSSEPYLDLDPDGPRFDAEEVVLFSGGLDSFAGALETLATTGSRVILLTHRSAQKVIPRQQALGEYLSGRFEGRVLHLQVLARRAGAEARDTTQRSRSFLFAALGQVVAHSFGAKRVSLYENGIVSHNLPFSRQIVGTMATRTTHPLALTKLNDLMRLVTPEPAPIENHYQWLTKTDVLNRIAQHGGVVQIPKAVSCTSVREQTSLHTHCGACSQCLDRRFAVLAAGLEAHDFAVDYATDVLFGERDADLSKTLAVEWTRHALLLGQLDERAFLERFGLELGRILRGHAQLSGQTALELTMDMHRRHSHSVRQVMEDIVRERAKDIVAHRIPRSSLVGMHLAQAAQQGANLPPDPRAEANGAVEIGDVPEEDLVPDPNAPLQVAFFRDSEQPVISVRGLGRVVGQPAAVPHALKPTFDMDRELGKVPAAHSFVQPTTLPDLADMTKEAIRSNVRRCRKHLAQSFEEMHGSPPDHDLLIQSRPSRGYRLDPLIRVAPADETD